MENCYASIPSPIASSTPIHQVEYFSSHLPDKLDWNLDLIEHNYMSLVEEKERIIRQLKQTLSEKDQIIGQLHEMIKFMKEQNDCIFTSNGKGKDHHDEVDITASQLSYCQKISEKKPKMFVRNLMKLIFSSEILAKSSANGLGSKPGLPAAKLECIERNTFDVFPQVTHKEFIHITNQLCCDMRKKIAK